MTDRPAGSGGKPAHSGGNPGDSGATPDGTPSPATTGAARARRTPGRGGRRAVRPGAGDPDPSVGLRALDDLDVGWQPAPDDTNDDRLRRDVPPHW